MSTVRHGNRRARSSSWRLRLLTFWNLLMRSSFKCLLCRPSAVDSQWLMPSLCHSCSVVLSYVCVGDLDTLSLLCMLYPFFVSYSTFPPKFALTSPWKQHERLETLTQCAEWTQFMVQHLLGNLILLLGIFRSPIVTCYSHQCAVSVSYFAHGAMMLHLWVCGWWHVGFSSGNFLRPWAGERRMEIFQPFAMSSPVQT